jgi:Gas vesicle protein
VKPRRPRQTTVPKGKPARRVRTPLPARPALPAPPKRKPPARPPRRDVARIIDQSDASLVDVIDNLLNQGVVLNADLILALANVDLVYVRLSALLCAADRILPGASGSAKG